MNYLSDIEIAQSCTMKPITQIAQTAGVDEDYLELYGKYKAKVDYRLLREISMEITSSNVIPAFSRASAWAMVRGTPSRI